MKAAWGILATGLAVSTAWAGEGSAGWRISGSAAMRTIGTDFRLRAPAALNITRDPSGPGDVGFYQGTGRLNYEDGHLGPSYEWYDGTCYGVIGSASQITPTDRIFGYYPDPVYYDKLTFHSSMSQNETSYAASPYSGTDDQTVVTPLLQARRELVRTGAVSLGILAGYSFAQADAASGTRTLAQQRVDRRTTTYAYTYDHIGYFSGASDPGSSFPLIDDGAYTFFDVDYANSSGWSSTAVEPAEALVKTSSDTVATRANYVATGRASTEVTLHEIMLAPEASLMLGNRVTLGLAVGPTLNIIDAELKSSTQWVRNGNQVVSESAAQDDTTTLKVGVGADLSVIVDFTDRVFGQVSAGYRYVPSVTLDNGLATTEIDGSSFQGTAGIGIRL